MRKAVLLSSLGAILLLPMSAVAGEMLTGEQIRALVAGNTVQGAMEATGGFTEFYAEDGTIKGDGYAGVWSIEGDNMCFQYGSDPAGCWSVAKEGDQVQWLKDGKIDGTGTVLSGNPNNY
jgi:hypothetical protein